MLTALATLCVGSAFALLALGIVVQVIRNAMGRVPARGILLSVPPQPNTRGGVGTSRWETRTVRIDVEIQGRRPFEVNTNLQIPARFVGDVLPGATIAISVNPKRPGNITMTGPGVALPAFTVPAPDAPAPRSRS